MKMFALTIALLLAASPVAAQHNNRPLVQAAR